jgi:hypothetical protein
MYRRLTIMLALTVLVAPATGCAGLRERFTPPPTVVTEEATRAASGAAVRGDLDPSTPSDLPLWPSGQVVDSTSTDDAYSLTLTTDDAFDDVLKGVAAGFTDAGWEVTSDASGEEGGRTAILEVAREGREGLVTLTEIEGPLTQLDYVIATVQ